MTALPLPLSRSRTLGLSVTRRRGLQIALGMVWVLDAALQFQPYMYTRAFSSSLAATAQGNPGPVAHPITWAAGILGHHLLVCNTLFALIQLAIGAGLLWRPTVRLALAASIPWCIGVWWFGEGLGGVLTGATPVAGAPGGVILYALLAALVWPRADGGERGGDGVASVATTGPLGAVVPTALWALLWGGSAFLLLLTGNRAPSALHDSIAGLADGEPGWIKRIDSGLASAVAHRGTEVSIILAALCIVVALGVVLAQPATVRVAVVTAALLGAAFWCAEDFGAIFTSQGTDPNSGPLLVLLAIAFWPLGTTRPSS